MRERESPDQLFAANLRQLREQKGLSQTALADAMAERGVPWHQQTVARLEAGEQKVRFSELMALAAILKTSLDRFTWTQPEAGATEYVHTAGTRVARSAEDVASAVHRLLADLAGAERVLEAMAGSEYPRVQEALRDTAARIEGHRLDAAVREGIRRHKEKAGDNGA